MNKPYRPTYNITFAIIGLLLATSGFFLDGNTAYKFAFLLVGGTIAAMSIVALIRRESSRKPVYEIAGSMIFLIAGIILLTGDSNDKAAAAGLIAGGAVVLLTAFFRLREIANSK